MSWNSQKKKRAVFSNVYFPLRRFLQPSYFISIYRTLSKLSEKIYLYIPKYITSSALKSLKAFSVYLKNSHVAKGCYLIEKLQPAIRRVYLF